MKIRDEISRLFWISRSFLAKIEFKSVSFFAMKRGKWVIKFKSTVSISVYWHAPLQTFLAGMHIVC